jgi:hypothetical protein
MAFLPVSGSLLKSFREIDRGRGFVFSAYFSSSPSYTAGTFGALRGVVARGRALPPSRVGLSAN